MTKRMTAAWLGLAALAAAAAMPLTAAAASPVSTAPLAADEVLLEVNAIGTATSRADLATITIAFICRGETEQAARRAHEAQVRALRAAARSAGVAAADIESPPAVSLGAMDDYADVQIGVDLEAPGEVPAEASAASFGVHGEMTITVRDVARAAAVAEALQAAGTDLSPTVAYSVSDEGPARREARARAVAAARADAEAYAAGLGLRVARVVRISERLGMDVMSMMVSDPTLAQVMGGAMAAEQGPDIAARAIVAVDFALAPR